MTIGDALFSIFLVLLGLAFITGILILIAKATKAALSIALALFGLALVLAMYLDALNGWPILGRFAWLFFQIIQGIYQGADKATSGIPQL